MKRIVFFLLIVAVSIFGMQQLKDVKEQLRMLRAAGVPEEELADLKKQEVALQAANPATPIQDFRMRLSRWRILETSNSEQDVIEKTRLQRELLNELVQQSQSRWFYTGNLLNQALELQGTPIVDQPPFGLTIRVPREVRIDLSNPLIYLVSFGQIENTCGFHALANAYAITQQVNENKPITYEATREIAQQVFKSRIESDDHFKKLACAVSFNEPEYSDLLSVIKTVGFHSNFDADPNFFLIDDTNINDSSVQPIQAQQIRFNSVTNFMYRRAGHFLIVSVENRNGNYTMFALDSLNSPLVAGSKNAQFIAHVDNLIQMAKAINLSGTNFEPEEATPSRVSGSKRKQDEIQ
jgi:hypothetical protein